MFDELQEIGFGVYRRSLLLGFTGPGSGRETFDVFGRD
jgi:hypothetical protein